MTSIFAAGTPAATSPRLMDSHTATTAVTRRVAYPRRFQRSRGQLQGRVARRPTLLRPEPARPRRHHHLMPARVEPPRELPELDGGSREVVSLGGELQNAHH